MGSSRKALLKLDYTVAPLRIQCKSAYGIINNANYGMTL